MTKIPTNFADRKTQRDMGHWFRVAAIICIAIAVFGCIGGVVYVMASQPTEPVGAVVGAHAITLTPFRPITNTPDPTDTPPPSRTPYPTITHTPAVSDNMEEIPVIRYKTVVVTVERIITATPAHTPTVTASETATPDRVAVAVAEYREAQAKERAWNIEKQIRDEKIVLRIKEWIFSPILLSILFGAIIMYFLGRIFKQWLDRKTAPVEENAEEIVSGMWVQERAQILALLTASIQEYGEDSRQLLGHRRVDWTGDEWTEVIANMRAAGCSIYTKPGQGTWVMRHNLAYWLDRLTPTPPLRPNNLAVQNNEQNN